MSRAVTDAYLLHRYDWSETSLIVELFTRAHGRVAAAAKGAKRPYSQLRTVLLPFQRMAVTLAKPKDEAAEIFTLRTAEWAGGGPVMAGEALFAGFYLNETLLRLLPRGDADAVIFNAYAATLPALSMLATRADDGLCEAALRAFELLLLARLGVLPALDRITATGELPAADQALVLTAPAGLVPASATSTAALSGAQCHTLAAALSAVLAGERPLSDLQLACAPAGAALKTLLRALLLEHLGERHWRTREVLRSVQQLG